MLTFNIILILIAGLCFGSFIGMASYRFGAEDISLRQFILRNSFCPNCGNGLKIKHLFPVLSWLIFKGRCGFCHKKISIRYPLIEISTALLFLGIFFALGAKIDLKLVLILLMAVTLMIMIIVDIEHYFIPNLVQIFLAILILIYHLLIPSKYGLMHYFIAAVVYFSFGIIIHFGFYFFTKKHGIGEDDIKFFTFAGLMLGLDQMMAFMILSGVFGMIFGIIWTKLKKDETFPFAPALAASFLICVLFKIDMVEILGNLLYLAEKYITRTAY